MNYIVRIICVVALGVPVLSGGNKNIKLALETSLLFEPQDIDKHMELISDARRFLDILENAIVPKKALRDDRPRQTLTDFISRLAETILQLYEADLETFLKVLENEMKNQFLKGSIFRDIVYDPKLQTLFRNKLKEWANTDPRQMKAKLRQYMARDANRNDTLHELGRFLNDYYGREQEFKMDEIIKRLKSTLDESEISFIVRDALNTLVLQHYDKMNYTTRAKLVEKINSIKHEYFTSNVDHDLMLTFRKRTKPKESNSLEYMDAWLHELEKKAAAVADIDLNDVDVQVPFEDKDAPVLTIDDWDNWLSNRKIKGVRKIHTLMSDSIESMIKAKDSKFKNKHKYKIKTVKVKAGDNGNYKSIDESEKVNSRTDFQLRKTVIDEHVDKPEKFKAWAGNKRSNEIDESQDESRDKPGMVKTTPDSKLESRKNDESTDKPEKIKASTLRSNENDTYIDELKKSKTSGFKLRKNDFDVSEDEPEKVKTSTKGSNENDKSTDKSKNVKTTAGFKLGRKVNVINIDKPKIVRTTADSKVGSNKNNISTADSKLEMGEKIKDFNSKYKHTHKKRKRKPIKFNANFLLGNRNNKESKEKLKKDKGTADFKLRNGDEEGETETSTRNKDLTTVDVFSQLYGVKPNKELIIDKNLEIFVGGFDARLLNDYA